MGENPCREGMGDGGGGAAVHGEAWDVVCPPAAGVPEGARLSVGANPGLPNSLWRAELQVITQIEVMCVCGVCSQVVCTRVSVHACACASSYSPC